MHISQWVESLLSRENIEEILDSSLCGDYDPTSAFKTVEIAVSCVCRNSGDRPGMSQVVTALKESLAAEVERKRICLLYQQIQLKILRLALVLIHPVANLRWPERRQLPHRNVEIHVFT
ncbi:hypothetical protein Bca52824_011047 [Brassica carinata]|uniref:Uncharacterized protein n=1 Tax=Brassica carinata TaxID=52824 RepID=A0A8X7WCS9_BRACI|nr:hypothetical protein Bca52824_011047 [Brassica carinata]